MEVRKRKRCLRAINTNTRTGGSTTSRWAFTLGVAAYLVFASGLPASYAESAQEAQRSPRTALSLSSKEAVIVEKDTLEKFGKDVEVVLHVLKASEYGSDPTIPGTIHYRKV